MKVINLLDGKSIMQLSFILLLSISLIIFYYYGFNDYLTYNNLKEFEIYTIKYKLFAPFIMILLYIALNITGIPRVFFTILAGYVYGVFYGFLFAWVATIAGLFVSFVNIRFLFKESFKKKFGSKKFVKKLDVFIEKYNFWSVIVLRAAYIFPSSFLNYTYGITSIKTHQYMLGSAIGFIPVVMFNVVVGYFLSEGIS